MADIDVDTSALRAASQQLGTAEGRLTGLGDIVGDGEYLGNADLKSALSGLWRSWQTAQRVLTQDLDDMGTGLHHAAEAFDRSEAEAARALSGLLGPAPASTGSGHMRAV